MTIGQREATTVGSVISVNVGMPRDVEWAGRTVRTAIWKEPTDQRVAVEHDNLAGDRQADLRKMQSMCSLKIVRDPEKNEIPDRVNHEFPGGECPGLPVRQKLAPFDFSSTGDGIALNVGSFGSGAVGMFFGTAIQP